MPAVVVGGNQRRQGSRADAVAAAVAAALGGRGRRLAKVTQAAALRRMQTRSPLPLALPMLPPPPRLHRR
jgi:hypothetical protein